MQFRKKKNYENRNSIHQIQFWSTISVIFLLVSRCVCASARSFISSLLPRVAVFVVRFVDAIQLPLNASTITFSASTLCQDETPTAIVAPSYNSKKDTKKREQTKTETEQ